jgi:hypothetical protein
VEECERSCLVGAFGIRKTERVGNMEGRREDGVLDEILERRTATNSDDGELSSVDTKPQILLRSFWYFRLRPGLGTNS